MHCSVVSQVGKRFRISNSGFFQEGDDVLNKRTVYLFKIVVTLNPKRLRYSEYSIHPKLTSNDLNIVNGGEWL